MKWLIVKAGSTLDSILLRRGDFEDWIVQGSGLAADRVDVVPVFRGAPLPDFDAMRSFHGVFVTGSPAMVTDHETWSVNTAAWLRVQVQRDTPILGICYGHQLLAEAMGGRVGANPSGCEIGTARIRLTHAGMQDALLSVLRSPFVAQESHVEAVLALPPTATLLAQNDVTAHQAFRVGNAWGVQFHPEFDADIVRGYIRSQAEAIRAEGRDPGSLEASATDSAVGSELLQRFVEVAEETM